ncbi:MAG: ABC transporter substrate-binding protein [Candidatus Binatia bacterium]
MRRILRTLALLAAVTFPDVSAAGQAGSAEEIWRALENLPAAEREKKLVEGAKIEGGEMVWYTNTGVDNANRYVQAFKKAYPFIDAKFWRAKSRDVAQKFLTESRAGIFVADVVKTTTDLLPPLFERNLVGRYESPPRAAFPAQAKGALWTSTNYEFRVFGYNPKRVARQEVPKTWDELLHPRWTGQILFDESSLEEILALRGTWGKDKTVAYLKKLRPQLLVRRGRDNIANLMMAGEAPLAVTIYPYNAETLRAQGAPIDWVAPDVITTLVYPLTMSRSSPHPHAAALFYDFLLSDAGQQMLAKEGRFVSNPKFEPIYPKIRELRAMMGTPRLHLNTVEDAAKHHADSLKILDEIELQRK